MIEENASIRISRGSGYSVCFISDAYISLALVESISFWLRYCIKRSTINFLLLLSYMVYSRCHL